MNMKFVIVIFVLIIGVVLHGITREFMNRH